MKALEQREFEYLISSRRKNPRLVAQTLGKTIFDAGKLIKERKPPHHLGEAIYEGCKSIADYAHDEGIENIVLVDKSARPLWVGIARYWSLAHSESRRPGIHFINPASFRTAIGESGNPYELSRNITKAGIACREELRTVNSPLVSEPAKPLMLADACLHSGRAVYLTKRVLQEAGFSDVRFGVVKTTLPSGGMIEPNIWGSDNALAARCIRSEPGSGLVVNSDTSIFSLPAQDVEAMQKGADVRSAIGDIITQRFFEEATS